MTYLAITVLFFAEHLPEDGWKRPKLGRTPHVCTLLCVCVYIYTCVCVCETTKKKQFQMFNILRNLILFWGVLQTDVNIHAMVSLRGPLHAAQPLSSKWITAITLNLATRAFHTGILTLIVIGMILGLGHFLPA